MISDEERREVARKLSSLDEHIEGMPLMCTKQEHDAMALRAIRAVVGKGDIFHLLADLIDRPTCRNIYAETEKVGGCENGFKCSECGNMVEDYEDWYKANDSLFKCGNAAYREIAAAVCKGRNHGSYLDTVKRIIELAERPKSVMKSLGYLKFEGKMRRMRCLNCGAVHWEIATKTVRFSHCPYCGIAIDRFIEEEDRDERA